MIMAIQKTMMVSGLLGVSVLAAWYVWTGKFSIGDFVLFSSYVEQLYSPLTMFSACYRILQDASLNMTHMIKVSQIEPDIKDGPKKLEVSKGEISFMGVYFTHGTSVTPLLKNINFTIPAGKTYAIVGNSGGGKSTILKLLLRFYDVTMGKITIDGVDISEVTQKSLRQNIGVLPQNATLFNQDISYNIRYSRNSADQSEIEDAAKEAQIHEKITTLPQGYGTKVGENGVKLSGGEKRRVVIARAILEGAQIILLDEATTGLDNITEKSVWTALDRLQTNKTTIIVSHQLSQVVQADKILVLKDGEIVEDGTHAELRALKQYYEELWLLEHPEDTTGFYFNPSFGCTVPDCTCFCHTENESKSTEAMSQCSSMDCYCNCHDLEVEENVLAILKQESEEGMFDDSDLEGGKQANNTTEELVSNEEKSSVGKSRGKSDTEVLLETIHEVPSTEERDEVFNSFNTVDEAGSSCMDESNPLLVSLPKSPTPKLGQITPQPSFDVGDDVKQSPKAELKFQFPPELKSYSPTGIKSQPSGGIRSQSLSKENSSPDSSGFKSQPSGGFRSQSLSKENSSPDSSRFKSQPSGALRFQSLSKDNSGPDSSKSIAGKKRGTFSKNKSLSIQDEDDIKLVISGRSFNLKPSKKHLVTSLFSENKMLDMSLPEGKLTGRKSGGKLPTLVRSKTVDMVEAPLSPLRTFKEIQKQRLKKQEKIERAEEKERDRARTMIDEASSVVSLLPEDLAMMDTMPDHFDEDALHPLCASSNFPRGLESFRKPLLHNNSSSDRDTSIDMSNI